MSPYEQQELDRAAERNEHLARSLPYTPDVPWCPGQFSVGQRNPGHWDIYSRRRPGYVQWFYAKYPDRVAHPMAEHLQERAFRIRGEPGRVVVYDERGPPGPGRAGRAAPAPDLPHCGERHGVDSRNPDDGEP